MNLLRRLWIAYLRKTGWIPPQDPIGKYQPILFK